MKQVGNSGRSGRYYIVLQHFIIIALILGNILYSAARS